MMLINSNEMRPILCWKSSYSTTLVFLHGIRLCESFIDEVAHVVKNVKCPVVLIQRLISKLA